MNDENIIGQNNESNSIATPLLDVTASQPISEVTDTDYSAAMDQVFGKVDAKPSQDETEVENPYIDFFKAQDEKNLKTLKQNLSLASMNDADQEAEIIRLSKDSGLEPSMIRQNMVQVKRMVDLQRLDAEKLSIDSPILAEQLRNPAFAALAYDDIQHLGKWENLADNVKQVFKSAAAGVPAFTSAAYHVLGSIPGYGQDLHKAITGEDSVLLKPLAEWLHEVGDDQDKLSQWVQGDMAGFSSDGKALYDGLRSFGSMAPGMYAFLTTGNPAFIYGGAGVVAGGHSIGEGLSQGLSETQALNYGLTDAGIEILTEMFPAMRFLKDLKAGTSLVKTLGAQLAYEIPQEQIATVLQDLNAFAVLPSNKDKTFEDYLKERPAAAWHTMLATLTGTGAQTLTLYGGNKLAQHFGQGIEVDPMLKEFMENSTKAGQAQEAVRIINELTAEINESKTLERSKEGAKNFIRELFQSKSTENISDNVLIDANDLVEFAQENNINLSEFPLIQDQLQEAVDTGGFISIPIEEYLTEISNQEFGPALNELIRLQEDGMSVKEAKEWSEEANQKLIERADQIINDMPNQEQADQVYQQIVDQLVEAGTPREEANKDASLYRAFFTVMADRTDIDMLELYERYGLKVRRVMDDVQVQNPEQMNQLADLILAPQVTETVEATQKATEQESLGNDRVQKSL